MSQRRSPADELPVTLRFRPPRASPVVDLRGELPHFYEFLPMRPIGGGQYEATVQLGPGTYGYKFFLSGDEWLLDPDNPRTRAKGGVRNSVLVVGGTDEPLLHAPARPDVFVEDDGRLSLRAALRRGAGDLLSVRWDEGDGPRVVPMVVVAEEDEHLLFEVRLPVSARVVRYTFVLADGRCVGRAGGPGQAFAVELARVTPSTPAWWRDAVLYTIFVDRFRRGGGRLLPTHDEKARAGGDLDGISEALPYLSELGVTALHLTPVNVSPSAHRYDAIDPREVDPALGGRDALERLFEAAHARDMRVLLDLPVTHVHRDFFAFRDVRERGLRSPYARWFHVDAHPFGEGPEPGYRHYQKGQWQEPLLRLDEPEVVDYLAETFARWARLGADGFRIDAAADVPLPTLRTIAAAARAARDDVVLLGEIVPDNLHFYTRSTLDAATDFSVQHGLHDWIWRRTGDARRFADLRARRRFDRGGPGWTTVAFTATHDQSRLRSLLDDSRSVALAQLLVIFGAAVPALYYGDEIGLHATQRSQRDFDDAWPDRCAMPWQASGEARPREHDDTRELIQRAVRLRRTHLALRRGDETYLVPEVRDGRASDDLLVLRRVLGEEIIDVIVHGGSEERTIKLSGDAPSGADVLLVAGDASVDAGAGTATLGARSMLVLLRVPRAEDVALWAGIKARSRLLAGLAFREGSVESAPLPSHLYVTVTERCNLSCTHCITFAPERTRSGTARTLQPWLLDALREPFAAADYVGFVHGGESLTAPIFVDVLRAIQRARAGRPGRAHVHLLSNGMLLGRERVSSLFELGVTSLSVSLDGATEVTNDTLRLGGRFSTIVRNLGDAVRLRDSTGVDVRIGISTVVTAGNVDELPALGRLARDIGVDWLKVEELFPCTAVARREMIHARDPRVERRFSELRQELAGARIVLVDHRDPKTGCGCDAQRDPDVAEFRAADDFANRTTFQPCRMEWEQACIDPDGTVHPVAYAQPAIGELAQATLLDLWNGEPMRQLRRLALQRTRKAQRKACPITER